VMPGPEINTLVLLIAVLVSNKRVSTCDQFSYPPHPKGPASVDTVSC
jgi:hypothetical protein